MIKLFKVKEKQREIAESNNGKPPVKKQSAGELRLHRNISELNLSKTCTISFPNGKDDLMNFEVSIKPDEGFYLGGLSSQYRSGRKCVPQHSPGRLETCSQHKYYHLWTFASFHGTESRGSSQS